MEGLAIERLYGRGRPAGAEGPREAMPVTGMTPDFDPNQDIQGKPFKYR